MLRNDYGLEMDCDCRDSRGDECGELELELGLEVGDWTSEVLAFAHVRFVTFTVHLIDEVSLRPDSIAIES